MKRQPTVADIVMVIGGVVTFIFSFLDFFEGENAWATGLFPVTTIIAALGLAMALFVLLELLAGFKLPDFLTFNYKQMYVTWGLTAGVFMLAWLILDGPDKKAGLYLMLIGSLAMAVGSILNVLGLATQAVNMPSGTAAAGPGAPGRPVAPPPPPGPGGTAPPPPPPGPGATPPPPPPPPV
jgi:hypothetical protein